MAFKDLRAEIAELFDDSDRLDAVQILKRASHHQYTTEKRKAKQAEDRLDSRIRRKRARSNSDRKLRAIPRPEREVCCVLCRADFMSAIGLRSHLVQRHREHDEAKPPSRKYRVACVLCREGFRSLRSFTAHIAEAHPLPKPARSRKPKQKRPPAPRLTPVYVKQGARARVAYYRRTG